MYSKVYTLKFPSLEAAKIGVGHLSQELGGSIADSNIVSLSILLHKDGNVTLLARFETLQDMQEFERFQKTILQTLESVFNLREIVQRSAVAVFVFDREATSIT